MATVRHTTTSPPTGASAGSGTPCRRHDTSRQQPVQATPLAKNTATALRRTTRKTESSLHRSRASEFVHSSRPRYARRTQLRATPCARPPSVGRLASDDDVLILAHVLASESACMPHASHFRVFWPWLDPRKAPENPRRPVPPVRAGTWMRSRSSPHLAEETSEGCGALYGRSIEVTSAWQATLAPRLLG